MDTYDNTWNLPGKLLHYIYVRKGSPGGWAGKEPAWQCRSHKRCQFDPWVWKIPWSSVQFSHSIMSDSLWPHEPQHARPPWLSPTPGLHPNPRPSSRWCHPTIYPLLAPSPPALNLSQHQGLFKWVSSLQEVAKVLEFQLQHQSFQWTPRTDLL